MKGGGVLGTVRALLLLFLLYSLGESHGGPHGLNPEPENPCPDGVKAWCLTCTDVATDEECDDVGTYEECPSVRHICFRLNQTHGQLGWTKITKGCKPISSCDNAALGPDNQACDKDDADQATTNCLNCDYKYAMTSCNLPSAAPSCLDHYEQGSVASGVYTIMTGSPSNETFYQVYCDMDTDQGGWTVIQRRFDGSVDFEQTWAAYRDGFGQASSEYWIGNSAIRQLTSSGQQELRIDLEDWDGGTRYAKYATFSIDDESNDFQLTIGGYSGDAGDSLAFYHNGALFGTYDRPDPNSCSPNYSRGGWWYYYCQYSNLNGQYDQATNTGHHIGIEWQTWHGWGYSLKATKMMLRP